MKERIDMSKIKVVTDSSCTIDPKLRDELEIEMIPLSISIDQTTYVDDDTMTGERFMELMDKAENLPKTSQPPIGKFLELYDQLGEDGSQVLSIHMAKELSGTVDSARQAADLSQADVTVIDSRFIDQSLAFIVTEAAEMAKSNKELPEILTMLKTMEENSRLYIGISTLENLVKGGRISRTTGILSNLLNIRVVMEFVNGNLLPNAKGRGNKTFEKWFVNLKEQLKASPPIKKIGISYTGSRELAEKFATDLQEFVPKHEITILHTNAIVATHTGRDAFAIMYYSE